tara:strand:+ start:31952 stop:32551 length:600 start_codon:yes stop_codon:yes gene_type:complete
MRLLIVGFIALLLSSCGFQLRGSGGYDLSVESVSILASNSRSELADELEDTLKSIGVEVNPTNDAEYMIRLSSETTSRRPVASSGNITVSEYEVRVQAVFSVVSAQGKELIPDTALTAERIYSFDTSNFVGNAEEESVLVEEMRQDIAGQLVRRFSATLRNQNANIVPDNNSGTTSSTTAEDALSDKPNDKPSETPSET